MQLLLRDFLLDIGQLVLASIYVWLPIALIFTFWQVWVYYVRAYYIANLKWTLLEIKLPREIMKTPKAMEIALHAFHQTSDGHLIKKYWDGFVRPWFSLEIASFEGEIHFFIRTQSFFRRLVESQIYAQYPGVELVEVDDYTEGVPYGKSGSNLQLFGTEFTFTKEDAYPIKTYVDFGMIENLEEEQKIDPITHFLEFMGSIGPGEQIWFQILIQATKKRFLKSGAWFEKEDWKDQGKVIIDKLMKRDKKKKEGEVADWGAMTLSPGERTIVEAVEKSVSKLGFDVGIRTVYLAEKDSFNAINIAGLMGSVKQYNTLNLNGFKPIRNTNIDYIWQDFTGSKIVGMKKGMFDAYVKRSYFYHPYQMKPMVLNTEELATIYHFPGKVAETPTFGRIESKKVEPPTNLPI